MTLFGHDEAIAAFAAAMQGDRLHHAWLLTGPRGVGKRTFADMAALRLLAEAAGPSPQGPGFEVASDHRIAKLIHAHSHPDYRCLTRPPRDKKERAKPLDERDPDAELARNIPIDSVRGCSRCWDRRRRCPTGASSLSTPSTIWSDQQPMRC